MKHFCITALVVVCAALATADPNLVQNGSFENNNVAENFNANGNYFGYLYSHGTYWTPSTNLTASPWTFTGSSGITSADTSWEWQSAESGNYCAFLQFNAGNESYYGGTGAISQTLSGLTAGDKYEVTFYADERNEWYSPSDDLYPNTLNVSVGGAEVFSQAISNLALDNGNPPGNGSYWEANYVPSDGPGWEEYEASFVASSSTEVLEFAIDNPYGDIAGNQVDSTTFLDNVSVTPTSPPVPEPFTMTLGIAGVALAMRRRARKTV